MENYSYQSYPDSRDSSPRSREIDFENPPTTTPWEDQQQQQSTYKVKFMCSYGGKIQPRPHDNQLSYVAGETKILAVDRNIKFPSLISKLCSLIEAPDLSFKYQLPGEDLDALISVTNDDDLDHMMHEYDRLYRASNKPARMRLFLFVNDSAPSSTIPDPIKPSNVDYLFGIDKPLAVPPPITAVKFHDPVPEPVALPPEYHPHPHPHPRSGLDLSDRVVNSDPGLNHPAEIQRQLQRMQIAENEQTAYRRKSEDNLVGNYPAGGDYYVQKSPEKFPVSNFAAPPQQQHQPGYWTEKPISGESYPAPVKSGGGDHDQHVYMVPAPGTYYHAPVMRPPATQGYYAVQRMPSDAYREAQVYGGAPPPKAPYSTGISATYAPAQPVSVVRSTAITDNTGGSYAQVAYDSTSGRQVYYNAPGGVVHAPPYQGVAAPVTADVKVISKISQGSV